MILWRGAEINSAKNGHSASTEELPEYLGVCSIERPEAFPYALNHYITKNFSRNAPSPFISIQKILEEPLVFQNEVLKPP